MKAHLPILIGTLLLSATFATGSFTDRHDKPPPGTSLEALAASIGDGGRPDLLEDLLETPAPANPGAPLSGVERIGEPALASEVLANLGITPLPSPNSAATENPPSSHLAGAPPELQGVLGDLVDALDTATAYRDAALGQDPTSSFQAVSATYPPARNALKAHRADTPTTESVQAIERHLAVLEPLDRDLLHAGLIDLVTSVEDAQDTLAGLDASELEPIEDPACAEGDVLFEIEHTLLGCYLVVGGPGPNTYVRNVTTLMLDLGGQDTYLNAAGGYSVLTQPLHRPAGSVLLDLGRSNDTYNSTSWDLDAVQGAGLSGYGVLVDAGGSDTYRVVDASRNGSLMAQGSGWNGAGLLWDQGQGDDRYTSREGAQGDALSIGLGVLLDAGGDDAYRIPYTFDSEGGQGTGCFDSIGALVDQGEGNDTYRAAIDDMQGMGCVRALGLLWDGGGPDGYLLESGFGQLGSNVVVQSGWGQGYGELGAAGLLVDRSGDDWYEAQMTGESGSEGASVQGTATIGALGLLLDGDGDDRYHARKDAQGSAMFGAAGILVDREGDDAYHARIRCQGHAWPTTGSAGILIDGSGEDTYACGTDAYPGRWDGAAWTSGGSGTFGFLSTGVGWDLGLDRVKPGLTGEPTVRASGQDTVLFTGQTGSAVTLTAPDGRSMTIRVNVVTSGSVVGEVGLDGQVRSLADVRDCTPLPTSIVEVEGELVGAAADGTWTMATGTDNALGLPAGIRLEVQGKAFEDAGHEFGECNPTLGSESFRHVRTWNWHASPEGTYESRGTPVAPMPEVGNALFHPAESPFLWRTFSAQAPAG